MSDCDVSRMDDFMSQPDNRVLCDVCGVEVKDYNPQICCSSFDCGCGGRPLEPPICSNECWDSLMSSKEE